jgi:hypothetical protein
VGLFDRFQSGRGHAEHGAETPATGVVQVDMASLSRVFSAPMWLRDLGLLAWFLVGVALLLAGAIWLVALTQVIVGPVLVGCVLARWPGLWSRSCRVGASGARAVRRSFCSECSSWRCSSRC